MSADLPPEERGLAVVEYTCKGIRVVKGCRLPGDYGFLGMTRREQMVRLTNADEVKANLPFSGGAIGGRPCTTSGSLTVPRPVGRPAAAPPGPAPPPPPPPGPPPIPATCSSGVWLK